MVTTIEDRQERIPQRKPVPFDWQFNSFTLPPLSLDDAEIKSPCSGQSPTMYTSWTPFFLTRTLLLGFITLFASFFITLAALFAYSQSNQGLSNVEEQNFYLWTYGPTAVLTIVAAFWGQVVYRTKQLMPWKAMATKPQSASRSVLLDYVSPISPIAFWSATSNAHYSVNLVIASSFIFTAMTIFSTGLLTLQHIDVTAQNVSLTITNKFDWFNFDWSSVDARPTDRVYAILKSGLDYPAGTTAQYAVQEFGDTLGSNATLNGTVDTFSAYLECEEATLHVTNISELLSRIIGPEILQVEVLFTVNITSPTYTIANVAFESMTNPSYIPRISNGTFYNTFGLGRFADCVESGEHRVLISMGTIRIIELWNGTNLNYPVGPDIPYDQMFHIVNSTNVLCTPHYRIAKSQVVKKVNAASRDVFESISPTGAGESQIKTAMDIARGVFQSINDETGEGSYLSGLTFPTTADSFFTLLTQERPLFRNNSAASKFWLQYDNLVGNGNLLYSSIAAQIAAQKLLVPTNESTGGSVTVNESRLFVHLLSFTLMEACLVMLISTAAFLLFYTSHPLAPHDPGSMSGIATILSKSPEFCNIVKDSSASSITNINLRMRGNVFHRDSHSGGFHDFAIQTSRHGVKNDDDLKIKTDGMSLSSTRWWQPMVLTTLGRLVVVLTPLAYIAMLEVLFTVSQSHNGLLNVDSDSWLDYGWTYIPALAMVFIHMLYLSASFSLRVLGPYATMKDKPTPANISFHDNPLSRVALHELFVSVKRSQLSSLAVTLAALLAPLLTIVVPGLYTAEHYIQDVSVRQLTTWKFNSSYFPNHTLVQDVFNDMNELNPVINPSEEDPLIVITDLIVTANLSYPKWSYGELALPAIAITSPGNTSVDYVTPPTGSLDVSLPAVRGVLNCTVVPNSYVNVTYDTYNTSSQSAIYNEIDGWTAAGNRQCLNGTGLDPFIDDSGAFPADFPRTGCRVALFSTSNSYTLGGCSIAPTLLFLPTQTNQIQVQDFGYFTGAGGADGDLYYTNYTYCPMYTGMIGSTTSTHVKDYTWFFCSTDVQIIKTQTTFRLPDYSISMVQPDESAASSVASQAVRADKSNPTVDVEFSGPNSALLSAGESLTGTEGFSFYNVSGGQNYDNFFSALVYGRDGIPASEMTGASNVPRLLSAVQHLWRITCAQQFRTNYQWLTADPSALPQQPLNATLMSSNAYRLKQNFVSTRILQGILGAMSLCAMVTFLLMDTHRVLPNNPSTIAVVASLLAGSEMLNGIASKESKKDHDHSEQHEWDGYFFSLGWWGLPDGGKRFGIDIGKAEKAS